MLPALFSNRDLDMDPGLQNPGAILGCSDHLALVVAGHLSADSLRIYTQAKQHWTKCLSDHDVEVGRVHKLGCDPPGVPRLPVPGECPQVGAVGGAVQPQQRALLARGTVSFGRFI